MIQCQKEQGIYGFGFMYGGLEVHKITKLMVCNGGMLEEGAITFIQTGASISCCYHGNVHLDATIQFGYVKAVCNFEAVTVSQIEIECK